MEMNSFRLHLLIELPVLTDMVSKGHNVVDRRYPVQGCPSFTHLVEHGVKEQSMTLAMHFLGNKLAVGTQAVVDNVCDESWPHVGDSWDVFYKGQSLYRVAPVEEGVYQVVAKHYGETEWEPLNAPPPALF